MVPALLAQCQFYIVCLQDCQYTDMLDYFRCGVEVRFSACRRAAVASRWNWRAGLMHSFAGGRFSVSQLAGV
eukprot:1955080-Pyramimonas_sp.AAC.2